MTSSSLTRWDFPVQPSVWLSCLGCQLGSNLLPNSPHRPARRILVAAWVLERDRLRRYR